MSIELRDKVNSKELIDSDISDVEKRKIEFLELIYAELVKIAAK